MITYFPGCSLNVFFFATGKHYEYLVAIAQQIQKPGFSSQDLENNTISEGKMCSDKHSSLPSFWDFTYSPAFPLN